MQRIFSDKFIQEYKKPFPILVESKLSETKSGEPLLDQERLNKIFKCMAELLYDETKNISLCTTELKHEEGLVEGEKIEGQQVYRNEDLVKLKTPFKQTVRTFDYEDLLIELNELKSSFLKNNKQLVAPLEKMRKAIVKHIDDNFPKFAAKLQDQAVTLQKSINENECIQKGTIVGVGCCVIWGTVIAPITLFKAFCGDKTKKLNAGELSCCDPVASVQASCAEYDDVGDQIKRDRNKGPIHHMM